MRDAVSRDAGGPVRPARLREGATIAVLSTSWGGPAAFPGVYDAGVAALRERLGLEVREYPTTRWSPAALAADPAARAADLVAAFEDVDVDGIVASIGGDDSARVVRLLDARRIAAHPKVLMGYSDTTTQLWFCHRAGMVTFHGPSVMAGLAQLASFPAAEAHLRALLFEPTAQYDYEPYDEWVDGYADWSSGATSEVGPRRAHDGWRWLHTPRRAQGRLLGGCIEVLEFMKGSPQWPEPSFFDGRLLFLETSEEQPSVAQVRRWLFNYGIQGIFERISGLLVGRARGYGDDEKRRLDDAVLETVVGQFGASDVTIVTNMDFGHTDPQWVLPLGVLAALDPEERSFRLLEPAVD